MITKSKIRRKNKGCSILENLKNYVVLDLETTGLSPEYDEIIEIGAIRVDNGIIVDKFETFIKPSNEIDQFITSLTGITNQMVEDAPCIQNMIEPFTQFIKDDIVIGHNINFDINFLYDNRNRYSNKPLTNDFLCTMRLARRLYPNWDSYKLSSLVEQLNPMSTPSHRAMDDVFATNECYRIMCDYAESKNINLLHFNKNFFKQPKAKDITTTNTDFDTSHPLYGAVCVFTGELSRMKRKEAMQLVVDHGGFCNDAVTRRTNILVLGDYSYCSAIKGSKSGKHKKAEQLQLKGQDIVIIPEGVFYEMLEDYNGCRNLL